MNPPQWLSYPAFEAAALLRMSNPLVGRFSIYLDGGRAEEFFDAFALHGWGIEGLQFNNMSGTNMRLLARAFERLRLSRRDEGGVALTEIWLSDTLFIAENGYALARNVLPFMSRITMRNCKIYFQTLSILVEGFSARCTHLNLSGEHLGHDKGNAWLLARALTRCTNLERLELSSNDFGTSDIEIIAGAICDYTSLPAVAALRGVIGSEAHSLLCEYVSGCPKLKMLDVNCNNLFDFGLIKIARMLSWKLDLAIRTDAVGASNEAWDYFDAAMTKAARFRRHALVHGRRDPGERPFCYCPIGQPKCDCGCTNL